MYSLKPLTIDGITSFLQLMDVQKVCKYICVSVQTKVTGNNALFKMAKPLQTLKDLFMF